MGIERSFAAKISKVSFEAFKQYVSAPLPLGYRFHDQEFATLKCSQFVSSLGICPVQGESYRSGKKFGCGYCGWLGDADLNGAKNISLIGQLVNLPRGSELACSLEEHVLGLLKAPSAYAVG